MKTLDSTVLSDLKFITDKDLSWDVFNNKTVLISGAAGFLPSYMVDVLLYLNEKKHYNIRIIGLVRNISKARSRFAYAKSDSRLEFIEQDVCDEIDIDNNIDYIIHAASNATPKLFREYPVETILPNVIGTKNLLNLAVNNKVEGFLFFSTSGVYGYVDDNDYPIKEDCFGGLNPTDLESCYLESKRMGENMCIAWMHQHGVPVKIIRPAITYGPGIELGDGRSFADFIACIVENRDIELYSDGSAIRNFCYIADAIAGFFTVMLNGKHGEAYNVATDHEISIKDLAEYLVNDVFPEKELKVVMKANSSKNFLRMNFTKTTVDISKVKKLGWNLFFPIDKGFRRVVESYENENI
jgi:nucleoside-diphosphate-sugar epimerase